MPKEVSLQPLWELKRQVSNSLFSSRHKAELHVLSSHPTNLTIHLRTYTLIRTAINDMIWKAVTSAIKPGLLSFILAISGSFDCPPRGYVASYVGIENNVMENNLSMGNRPGGPQWDFMNSLDWEMGPDIAYCPCGQGAGALWRPIPTKEWQNTLVSNFKPIKCFLCATMRSMTQWIH